MSRKEEALQEELRELASVDIKTIPCDAGEYLCSYIK